MVRWNIKHQHITRRRFCASTCGSIFACHRVDGNGQPFEPLGMRSQLSFIDCIIICIKFLIILDGGIWKELRKVASTMASGCASCVKNRRNHQGLFIYLFKCVWWTDIQTRSISPMNGFPYLLTCVVFFLFIFFLSISCRQSTVSLLFFRCLCCCSASRCARSTGVSFNAISTLNDGPRSFTSSNK